MPAAQAPGTGSLRTVIVTHCIRVGLCDIQVGTSEIEAPSGLDGLESCLRTCCGHEPELGTCCASRRRPGVEGNGRLPQMQPRLKYSGQRAASCVALPGVSLGTAAAAARGAGSGLQVTSMPGEADSKLATWSNWCIVFIQDS